MSKTNPVCLDCYIEGEAAWATAECWGCGAEFPRPACILGGTKEQAAQDLLDVFPREGWEHDANGRSWCWSCSHPE